MSFSNRSLVALAIVIAASSSGAIAQEPVNSQISEGAIPTQINSSAPDVPPVTPEPTTIHEGSVVKTEIQASVEQNRSLEKTTEAEENPQAKVESLMAPVPGNQDNAVPQPTFNGLNTINTNILSYPLNDPINGQYADQATAPLVLRENSVSPPASNAVSQTRYQELPLNIDDAKRRLEQLKLMAAGSRPQDALEHVNQFIRWLSDIVDAHTKMTAAFAKNEATKTASASEKQLTTRFSYVRYQSQLLKADLLIEEHRNPEALAPLVEIVLAMPTGALGKAAYQRLQNLGFSTADSALTVPSGTVTATSEPVSPATETTEVPNEVPKKIAMASPPQHSKKQFHSKPNKKSHKP